RVARPHAETSEARPCRRPPSSGASRHLLPQAGEGKQGSRPAKGAGFWPARTLPALAQRAVDAVHQPVHAEDFVEGQRLAGRDLLVALLVLDRAGIDVVGAVL